MENCIKQMDEKALWDYIQNACLNRNQTIFQARLYRYTRGLFGKPVETDMGELDYRKLNAFLKDFCEKYQINGTFYDVADRQGVYTHTASVKLELTDTTVRSIRNAKLFQDKEKENIIRKKVISYYGPMSNSDLAKKLMPLVVKDFQEISVKKQQNLTAHQDFITIRCLIARNQLLIEPDYQKHCYRQYLYADYDGHPFDGVEMSALAMVLLDAVFLCLEQDYSKQLTTKEIRILNIGVEITIRVEGFLRSPLA